MKLAKALSIVGAYATTEKEGGVATIVGKDAPVKLAARAAREGGGSDLRHRGTRRRTVGNGSSLRHRRTRCKSIGNGGCLGIEEEVVGKAGIGFGGSKVARRGDGESLDEADVGGRTADHMQSMVGITGLMRSMVGGEGCTPAAYWTGT